MVPSSTARDRSTLRGRESCNEEARVRDRPLSHPFGLFTGLFGTSATGHLVQFCGFRSILGNPGAALAHDGEVVATRRPSKVARTGIEAGGLGVVLGDAVREFTHSSRKDASGGIAHVARVFVESGGAGFVLVDSSAEREALRKLTTAVSGSRIALGLALCDV